MADTRPQETDSDDGVGVLDTLSLEQLKEIAAGYNPEYQVSTLFEQAG